MPFAKGHSGNPKGRKGGTPAKTPRIIRDAFIEAFHKIGGTKSLVEWGKEQPGEFYKIIAKLCPKEVEVSGPDGGPIQTSVEVALVAASQKNQG